VIIVVRHSESAQSIYCRRRSTAPNHQRAGDSQPEHPTQALLDALTIRRRRGSLQGHWWRSAATSCQRGKRSDIHLLQIMGARVRGQPAHPD
jgi:aspartate carbamoyltransferase catalytic subunit